jgi:hypothetical protein
MSTRFRVAITKCLTKIRSNCKFWKKCPGGANDRSPALQRWENERKLTKSRRDDRTLSCSFPCVTTGCPMFARSVCKRGIPQLSLLVISTRERSERPGNLTIFLLAFATDPNHSTHQTTTHAAFIFCVSFSLTAGHSAATIENRAESRAMKSAAMRCARRMPSNCPPMRASAARERSLRTSV